MLNQFINICFMTASGTAQGIAMEYMLETNDQRTKRWFRILFWTVLAIIPSILNAIITYAEPSLALRNSIHWGCVLFAILFFYLGPLWRRFLAAVLMYIGLMSSDLSLLVVLAFTDFRIEEVLDKSNDISVFFTGIATLICISSISFIVVLWRKVFYPGKQFRYFLFFIIYIMNHMGVYWLMEQEIWKYDLSVGTGMAGLTSTICAIVLMIVIFSQVEKESLEKHLKETKRKNELEQLHLQETQKRRNEIAEISKRNGEDILSIQNLLKSNQVKEAENSLKDMLHRIELTREYPYCSIPIINAIISEKKKQCDELGISLHVELRVAEELHIKQMDLCSICSNLLDNAIRESEHVLRCDGEANIELRAAVTGAYLVIKCKNNIAKMPGDRPERTGYGLKILKDIAERYDGNLRTTFTEKEYEAQISVKHS